MKKRLSASVLAFAMCLTFLQPVAGLAVNATGNGHCNRLGVGVRRRSDGACLEYGQQQMGTGRFNRRWKTSVRGGIGSPASSCDFRHCGVPGQRGCGGNRRAGRYAAAG